MRRLQQARAGRAYVRNRTQRRIAVLSSSTHGRWIFRGRTLQLCVCTEHLGERLCVESSPEMNLRNHGSDSGAPAVRIHGPVPSSSGRPTVAPSMASRTDEALRESANAEPSASGRTTAEALRHRLPNVASNSHPTQRQYDRRREPLDEESIVRAEAGHGIVMSDPKRSQRSPVVVVRRAQRRRPSS
jgi:hypothetical protein